MRILQFKLVSAQLIVGILFVTTSVSLADEPVTFEQTAAQIFLKHCMECHNSSDPAGSLDLARPDRFRMGGDSGAAVVAGDVNGSLLMERVISGEMPPDKNGVSQKLSDHEIDLLKAWINAGSPWPEERILDPYEATNDSRAGRDWWSLQPVIKPEVPKLNLNQQVESDSSSFSNHNNEIDAFIAATLRDRGLTPAPPASRQVLIRRVYNDLIGLPPTAEEIDQFVQDESPNAYERLVDRLLAMPQFGERWARHWLDVARFADTNGYERDAVKPNVWKYRDWVVNAINQDKPYNEFVIEQLAGDEVQNRDVSTVTATAFLQLGAWDDEPNDPAEYVYERLEDMVHVSTTSVLGLTVKCARCHDHKFDPITHADYYRIAAAFWTGPIQPRDRDLMGGPTKDELGFDLFGWTDVNLSPEPLHVLRKGNIHQPLEAVSAGPLSCVTELNQPFVPTAEGAKTAGSRLQLAQWMTDVRNPLTPRVIVNRLWLHHFGEGIVRDPDNFGFNGPLPSHPELLDWLASELMEGGWKLKRIHKLMVMSRTYQQSSLHPLHEQYGEQDSANQFLWRAFRKRLDAESLRDAILLTSGHLDLRMGGPSFYGPISSDALEGLSMKGNAYQQSSEEECRRRSLYLFSKRGLTIPMMAAFDQCDTTSPTGKRDLTTVAPQALALLNNDWVHSQSRAFAERVTAFSMQTEERIDLSWRLALGRKPSQRENEFARSHIESQQGQNQSDDSELLSWVSLCHVLLNTNEFIYRD